MIRAQSVKWPCVCGWLLWIFMCTAAADAFGAEAAAGWRPTYDLVMRWLNFLILIVLFFKYARKPLVAFLKGKSKQIEENIKAIEKEKDAIQDRVDALLEKQEQSRERLRGIKERIVSQGKLKKQKIIDDAKMESQLLLESAHRRMTYEIAAARDRLQAALVDQAIELAIKNIPQQMTEHDTQQALQSSIDNINTLPEKK